MSYLKKTRISLGATIFICAVMALLVNFDFIVGKDKLLVIVMPFIFGMFLSLEYWLAHKRHNKKILSTLEKKEALKQRTESERQSKELQDKWYIRYPFVMLLLATGVYISIEKSELLWVSIVCFSAAAYYGRELALFALITCVSYFFIQGVTTLPISAAIIIGAMIIAGALRK